MDYVIVKGVYDITGQTYVVEVTAKDKERTITVRITPDECKELEESLYEARNAMPWKLLIKK